jgi:hypothetical protein
MQSSLRRPRPIGQDLRPERPAAFGYPFTEIEAA